MHIDIALRFKLFSHVPGTTCLIPGTLWRAQVYPTLIKFFGPLGEKVTYPFSHGGPLEQFTIEQDLEKREVRILGKTGEQFLRSLVFCRKGELEFVEGKNAPLQIASISPWKERSSCDTSPRLSMGVHKKQEWEGIKQRRELVEILPLWFYLGAMTPHVETQDTQGVRRGSLMLLDECKHLLETRQRRELEIRLRYLFLAGFSGMFNPRMHDADHQGILSDVPEEDLKTALLLLSEGAQSIRGLFVSQADGRLSLLPCLLPSFYAGRFVNLFTEDGDGLDLEWSKGMLRRAILRPVADRTVMLEWPKELRHCKVRSSLKDRGRTLKRGEPLELHSHQPLFLDRFEK